MLFDLLHLVFSMWQMLFDVLHIVFKKFFGWFALVIISAAS